MLEPADCGRFRGDVWDGEVCWQYLWSQCTERCWDFEQNPESGSAREWRKRNADGLLSGNCEWSRLAEQPLGGCLVNDQSLESQFQKFLSGKGHIVWPATFLTSRTLSIKIIEMRPLFGQGWHLHETLHCTWTHWMHWMHCTWMYLTSWQSKVVIVVQAARDFLGRNFAGASDIHPTD